MGGDCSPRHPLRMAVPGRQDVLGAHPVRSVPAGLDPVAPGLRALLDHATVRRHSQAVVVGSARLLRPACHRRGHRPGRRVGVDRSTDIPIRVVPGWGCRGPNRHTEATCRGQAECHLSSQCLCAPFDKLIGLPEATCQDVRSHRWQRTGDACHPAGERASAEDGVLPPAVWGRLAGRRPQWV